MSEELRKRDRLIYGVVLPIVVMVIGLLIIMNVETGAGAAEFAALGIFLGAVIVSPFVLILNSIIAFQNAGSSMECFVRGMIVPGLVLIGAVVYQTGLWDAIT
jgi:hypothetical protein